MTRFTGAGPAARISFRNIFGSSRRRGESSCFFFPAGCGRSSSSADQRALAIAAIRCFLARDRRDHAGVDVGAAVVGIDPRLWFEGANHLLNVKVSDPKIYYDQKTSSPLSRLSRSIGREVIKALYYESMR